MSGSSDTNGDFGDDFVWILQASLNVGEKIQKELERRILLENRKNKINKLNNL